MKKYYYRYIGPPFIVAGLSAMREGPSILNKKASAAYKTISPAEKEQLQQVELATSQERQVNKKAVVPREEKIFMKIQKLVQC